MEGQLLLISYADKTLTCRDCGQTFTFTVSEQQFFAERGFQNEPSRCPECRSARRARGGDRDSGSNGRRELTDVTCSSCGKPAQVPFKPTEGRPVYCSDCYTRERLSTRSTSYR
ncbi:MAG TPA: zinc-ribbon domain containing protein [Chloroflexota bacterium]|nr:zinc-ribbon domain containing protein [Chloroflexota bacterium]